MMFRHESIFLYDGRDLAGPDAELRDNAIDYVQGLVIEAQSDGYAERELEGAVIACEPLAGSHLFTIDPVTCPAFHPNILQLLAFVAERLDPDHRPPGAVIQDESNTAYIVVKAGAQVFSFEKGYGQCTEAWINGCKQLHDHEANHYRIRFRNRELSAENHRYNQ